MTTYVNAFTGLTVEPAQVSYEALTISANTTLEWPINGNDTLPAASIMDITATTTGLQLILPPATQVSVGQQIVIRNVGTNVFTVTTSATNTQVVSVAAGVAQFIFLTNNATVDGTWSTIVLGAGTSTANAGQLAGFGLVAEGTTLNQGYPLATVFSNYTIVSTGQASFYIWTGGSGTLTLPAAVSVVPGWFCMIRNGGTGTLTLAPAASSGDTIDTTSLNPTESLVLVVNNTTGAVGYSTFGYGRSNTYAYTPQVINITSSPFTILATVAANTIQRYTTSLTGSATVVLPSTVQIYSVTNNTGYLLTFQTGTGTYTIATVANGSTNILVCDGNNIYNTTSGSISLTSLQLAVGSVTAPSLSFITNTGTGLYLPTSTTLGLAISGVNVATYQNVSNQPNLILPNGISGGTF